MTPLSPFSDAPTPLRLETLEFPAVSGWKHWNFQPFQPFQVCLIGFQELQNFHDHLVFSNLTIICWWLKERVSTPRDGRNRMLFGSILADFGPILHLLTTPYPSAERASRAFPWNISGNFHRNLVVAMEITCWKSPLGRPEIYAKANPLPHCQSLEWHARRAWGHVPFFTPRNTLPK